MMNNFLFAATKESIYKLNSKGNSSLYEVTFPEEKVLYNPER